MNARKVKRVEKREMLEELLALVRICFEGEAILYDGALRMTLPTGDSFVVKVEDVS